MDDTTGAKRAVQAVNATWRRYLVLTQIIKSDQFNSVHSKLRLSLCIQYSSKIPSPAWLGY